MTQRKEGGKYNFTKIKTPDKLTKHEIDTAILSAIILTKR